MKKAIGVGCLIVGILLLIWGHNISQSIGSQVKVVFTGSPIERAEYFYVGGALLVTLGLFQIFWPKK